MIPAFPSGDGNERARGRGKVSERAGVAEACAKNPISKLTGRHR